MKAATVLTFFFFFFSSFPVLAGGAAGSSVEMAFDLPLLFFFSGSTTDSGLLLLILGLAKMSSMSVDVAWAGLTGLEVVVALVFLGILKGLVVNELRRQRMF